MYDAFKAGVLIGTLIVRAEQPILHEDTLSGQKKPPPNYQQYAFINEL